MNKYTSGQLNSSGNCVCINGTTIDPNFCCSDWQCDALCPNKHLKCNSATNRCERDINVTPNCNSTCLDLSFGSGVVSVDGNCVCADCIGDILTDEQCLKITSGILGVGSAADENGSCVIKTQALPINPLLLCTSLIDILG
ncbi:hypothetical protein CHUAL_006645 [Chamberlinius hualienensis]